MVPGNICLLISFPSCSVQIHWDWHCEEGTTHFAGGEGVSFPFMLRDSVCDDALELVDSGLVGHEEEATTPRLCEQGWQVQFAKCIKARK